MTGHKLYFNDVYKEIIANSLFTERQIYIISNRLAGKTFLKNISRGAYHRQLKQCRNKITGLFYSLLLLKSIGAIDQQTLSILMTLSDQLDVILSDEYSDIGEDKTVHNVMFTFKHILKKMCNV
jgi:hypothetical protein